MRVNPGVTTTNTMKRVTTVPLVVRKIAEMVEKKVQNEKKKM